MSNKEIRPFHIAFPVLDLNKTKKWYTEILGCTIGRESNQWIDFNLFGHQIVAHLSKKNLTNTTNDVEEHSVPIRHFGVILSINNWKEISEKLKNKNINFLIKPYTRFKGLKGEQYTLFIKDPSGNALEFKAFKDDSMIFEH